MQKVAIIGAGHAGLLALRECLSSSNLDPICFEVSFQPYGIYHKINQNLYIDGFKTTASITSELEQIPADKIKFGCKVVCIKLAGEKIEVIVKKRAKKNSGVGGSDMKSSGSTDNLLSTPLSPEIAAGSDFDIMKGETSESPNSPPVKPKSFFKRYLVDKVIIASGEAPVIPDFDGMDDYVGKVIHSTEFKVLYPYIGQRVLVVGAGHIGVQIANMLADHCKVDLCCRGQLKLLPMTMAFGLDSRIFNSRISTFIPPLLKSLALELVLFITRGYGLAFSKTIPVPNPVAESFYTNIKAKKITLQPSINKFTTNGCMFTNGQAHDYALVICSTGFKQVYPCIDKEYHSTIGRVFSKKDDRIAFVGRTRGVYGSCLEVMEMQAKLVVQVFSGLYKLPLAVDFSDESTPVNALTYMDQIAKTLKIKPKLWWLALTNWSGLRDALFGHDILKQYGFGFTATVSKKPVLSEDIMKTSPVAMDS